MATAERVTEVAVVTAARTLEEKIERRLALARIGHDTVSSDILTSADYPFTLGMLIGMRNVYESVIRDLEEDLGYPEDPLRPFGDMDYQLYLQEKEENGND